MLPLGQLPADDAEGYDTPLMMLMPPADAELITPVAT